MSKNDPERGSSGPSWQVPQERQPETDAYHIWTSRPLLRSVYWKPVPAPSHDLVSSSYEVFVDQRAWCAMHEHVWQTPAATVPFGYLVGDLCEDPNANRRFVIVTGVVPARFDFDENGRDQISREAGLALRLEIDRQRGTLVGWYHRHLEGAVELSDQDMVTHTERFTEPWHCAFLFVGDGSRSKGGCFRSTSSGVSAELPFPFYEMASNESLLPRGLKRSYLNWENYETVDEVRSEPLERPVLVVEESESLDPDPVAPIAVAESHPASMADVDATLDVEPLLEVEPDGLAEVAEVEPEAELEPEPDVEPEPEVEPEAELEPEPEVEPELQADLEAEEEAEEEPEVVPEAVIDWDLDVSPEDVRRPDSVPTVADLVDSRIEIDAVDLDAGQAVEDLVEPDPVPLSAVEHEAVVEAPPVPVEEPVEEESTVVPEAHSISPAREVPSSEIPSGPPVRSPNRRTRRQVVGFEGSGRSSRRMVALGLGGVAVAAAVIMALVFGVSDTPIATGTVSGGGASDTQAESNVELPTDSPGGVSGDSTSDGPVTREQLEVQSQVMLSSISRFYGTVVAMDDGTDTCEDLRVAFVIVEDGWIEYNSRYKAGFPGQLPDDLAARDERLYLGVQDVEREFERSGCPRP